jgi:thiamine-monophosphate kinase
MSKKTNTLRNLGERGLIRWFQDLITPYEDALLYGMEDAVAVPLNDEAIIANSDMLVGSTDVLPGMSASEIAWKAGVMGLSDLAAKGASPLGVIVSLGLPADTKANYVAAIVGGLNCVCREHDTYYLGGDTNQCLDLVIDCIAIGNVPKNQILRRSGAKPGDVIATTGGFGYTGALFKASLQGYTEPTELVEQIRQLALRPRARLKEGQILARGGFASASIDSSDGLGWSLHELAAASGVGFQLDSLPIPELCKKFAISNDLNPADLALYGGEEFELIVTISPEKWEKAERSVQEKGGTLVQIGTVLEEPVKVLRIDGRDIPVEPKGFEHFVE